MDGVAYAPHLPIDVAGSGLDWYGFSVYKTWGPHMAALYGSHAAFQDLKVTPPNPLPPPLFSLSLVCLFSLSLLLLLLSPSPLLLFPSTLLLSPSPLLSLPPPFFCGIFPCLPLIVLSCYTLTSGFIFCVLQHYLPSFMFTACSAIAD